MGSSDLFDMVRVYKNELSVCVNRVNRCKEKYRKHFLGVGKTTRDKINRCHNMLAALKIDMNSFYGNWGNYKDRNVFYFNRSNATTEQITETAKDITSKMISKLTEI